MVLIGSSTLLLPASGFLGENDKSKNTDQKLFLFLFFSGKLCMSLDEFVKKEVPEELLQIIVLLCTFPNKYSRN